MAATKWQVYNEAKKYIAGADLDLNAASLRMKIVKGTGAAAVSNYALSTFASAGTAVSFANADAKTPSNISLRLSSNSILCFDTAAVVFTASGALTSLQYAVIGLSNSYAIAWCKLSTAAFSLGAGSTLTITPAAAGYFTISGGSTA